MRGKEGRKEGGREGVKRKDDDDDAKREMKIKGKCNK